MRTNQVRTDRRGRMLLLAAMLFLSIAPAMAQESFRATHIARLDGFSEVPEVITDATGLAIMRLDTVARTLEYRISISDISNVVGAHFHSGRPDTVGPIEHTIVLGTDFNTTHTVTGVWTGLEELDIRRLQRGGTIYINFHTQANPGGEIRGHVDRIPNLTAFLEPSEEVPPVRVPSNGSGDALIVLDPIARRLDYLITFGNLTSRATAAHFHVGADGVQGPPVHTIQLGAIPGRAAGTWSDISTEHLALLLTRGIYVNIHTDSNASGEIRGQVVPVEAYTTAISPDNEVVKPANSTAAGTGFLVIVSELESTVDLFADFVVDGTTGPITGAHIHVGPAGVAGDVIRTLEPYDPATGTYWTLPFLDSFIDSDSLTLFRSSGTYVNFHTAQWTGGELRGQLIPSANNLIVPTTSVEVEEQAVAGSALSASVERTTGTISFRIGDDVRGSSRTIALYSSIGTRIADVPVEGNIARIGSENLASGLYFAQLVIDGRPAGMARVVVAR